MDDESSVITAGSGRCNRKTSAGCSSCQRLQRLRRPPAAIVTAVLIRNLIACDRVTGSCLSSAPGKCQAVLCDICRQGTARYYLMGFLVQIVISLLTSTIYFSITLISSSNSELLARTTPTIWDVLIAVCDGFAGSIGFTRKEKSNVIPGVAIATALMPPLCTAGYGLATGQLSYFLGTFYLFTLNTYFICLLCDRIIDS